MSQKDLLCVGICFLGFTVIVYVFNPLMVYVEWEASFREGTTMFEYWKNPPTKVMMMFYIFNYTNSEAFLQGNDTLRIQEIGPYVYQEIVEYANLTINRNNTLTYIPRTFLVEDPEMSHGKLREDMVTVPNLALLGIASSIADVSDLGNVGFNVFASAVRSKPFLTMNVHDYLMGYEEPLLKYVAKIMPSSIVPISRVTIMDVFTKEEMNVVTVSTRREAQMRGDGNMTEPLTIDVYNGLHGLPQFGYVEGDNRTHKRCNTLQGVASEGRIIPRKVKSTDKFMVYRKYFCRALPFKFVKHTRTSMGIPAMYFNLTETAFNSTVSENGCFCEHRSRCLAEGLIDVAPCTHDMPFAFSAPHFLHGDPKLAEAWEGLIPRVDKHNSYIVLDSTYGVQTTAVFRIQSNLALKRLRYNTALKPFSNMTLPLMWIENIMSGLPETQRNALYFAVVVTPLLHVALASVLTFSTAIMFLVFFKRVVIG